MKIRLELNEALLYVNGHLYQCYKTLNTLPYGQRNCPVFETLYARSSIHMMRFAVRCFLLWNIGEIIFVGNTFNLSFFMIEVLLWSLACNGVLVANHDEWWVITVVLVKVLQCAIGCMFRISLSPRQIFCVW